MSIHSDLLNSIFPSETDKYDEYVTWSSANSYFLSKAPWSLDLTQLGLEPKSFVHVMTQERVSEDSEPVYLSSIDINTSYFEAKVSGSSWKYTFDLDTEHISYLYSHNDTVNVVRNATSDFIFSNPDWNSAQLNLSTSLRILYKDSNIGQTIYVGDLSLTYTSSGGYYLMLSNVNTDYITANTDLGMKAFQGNSEPLLIGYSYVIDDCYLVTTKPSNFTIVTDGRVLSLIRVNDTYSETHYGNTKLKIIPYGDIPIGASGNYLIGKISKDPYVTLVTFNNVKLIYSTSTTSSLEIKSSGEGVA